MPQVARRIARIVASLAALSAMSGLSVPVGTAEPTPSPGPAPVSDPREGSVGGAAGPGGTSFSLTAMGTVTPLTFYGDQGTAELTFPVPRGLVPAALTAAVELPLDVRAGMVTATQRERTLSRVPLPPTDGASIVIPLTGAEISDNAVTVTLRTHLLPAEGSCFESSIPLRLTDGAVSFRGVEAPPATVADFLPPILRKLTIAIPATPARAEADAAIRLAAAVTAHYGQQPTIVVVVPLARALAPAGPFERQVVVQQGAGAGLALDPIPGALPNLRISGPEGEVVNQSRLLTSDISRLALSSKAVVGPLKSSPQLPGDVTTLRALGQPEVSAVALSPQVSVGLDQTRMGRPAKSVRVHLIGSYTPNPASVSARMVAIVGGETIATWPVNSAGVIDRWVDVPDRLLQRYTTLGISFNVAGNTGRCGEFQPLTLTIDGDSVVQSEAAVPPVPAGLQSLPQVLMPKTLIAIGENAFEDTVRATALAVAMQRLSALPIDTEVTSTDYALKSRLPAIVVAADGWNHPDVALPVSADKDRLNLQGVVGQGGSTTLTLDPELKYAALQVVFDGRRSMLVATSNGAPGQLDELLRWVAADPRRWSRADGTAVISAPGREPMVVGPVSGVDSAAGRGSGMAAVWWVVGVGVVATTAVAALIIRRRRRSDAAG